jgi:type IV fimbrial biogenesis protein FimT
MLKLTYRAGRGFTLIEMMVVIAIIALIATLAAPAMGDMMASQRMRSSATDLVSSLLLARSEAIKRNAPVTIEPLSGTEWADGWQVLDDGGVKLDEKPALGARVQVGLSPASLVFQPTGRITTGLEKWEFSDSAGSSSVKSRCVKVDPSGLPKLSLGDCP